MKFWVFFDCTYLDNSIVPIFPLLKHLVYGGPNGELGASLRYLSQRYTMPDDVTKGLLTDIGVEELGHLEMVGTLVKQLSDGEPAEEWVKMGTWEYYADNGASVYPQSSQGSPFNAASIAVTGDAITNLFENLAAEQKARAVYDNILRLSDDPDVNEVIKFLRQREVTHFQRFGEALDNLQSKMKHKPVKGKGIKDCM
ncbi:MAG: manganese catalase family protein [Candidatus Ornithomonoglobus sp.]